MTRAEVVAAARRWLGAKYRHEGRDGNGLDCIGLVVVVGRAFNVRHTDVGNYTSWPDPQRRIFTEFGKYLALAPGHETNWDGTIGVFAQQGFPCHVGIFSTKHQVRHVIHSHILHRQVIEDPFDDNPRNRSFRLLRRYAFPGLED